MKFSEGVLLILLAGLLFSISGCGMGGSQQEMIQPNEVLMDEIIRSEAGGYAFRPLQGYETKVYAGTASMFLPDGDQQSGPGMLMMGYLFDTEVSIEKAAEVIVKTYPEYSFSKAREITIGLTEGVFMDFTSIYHAPDGIILENPGAEEGEQINGRVLVVMVSPTQQYRCLMLAPEKSWNDLLAQFEAVLSSVQFFQAAP